MQYLIALVALTICVVVEAQPRNDNVFGNVPYFMEQINPVLNRHRGRFRPFAGQKGSPIANIRSGRSVTDLEISTEVECVYAFESLFCAGQDKTGQDLKVECDATENFMNLHEDITEYALSDIRILKTGDSSMNKMYMFGKSFDTSSWMSYIVKDRDMNRRVLSVHSAADNLTDMGITVLDPACWERMTTFFKSMKNAQEMDIMNNQRPVKIMARLNVL